MDLIRRDELKNKELMLPDEELCDFVLTLDDRMDYAAFLSYVMQDVRRFETLGSDNRVYDKFKGNEMMWTSQSYLVQEKLTPLLPALSTIGITSLWHNRFEFNGLPFNVLCITDTDKSIFEVVPGLYGKNDLNVVLQQLLDGLQTSAVFVVIDKINIEDLKITKKTTT
jgi:hypothetical protein